MGESQMGHRWVDGSQCQILTCHVNHAWHWLSASFIKALIIIIIGKYRKLTIHFCNALLNNTFEAMSRQNNSLASRKFRSFEFNYFFSRHCPIYVGIGHVRAGESWAFWAGWRDHSFGGGHGDHSGLWGDLYPLVAVAVAVAWYCYVKHVKYL